MLQFVKGVRLEWAGHVWRADIGEQYCQDDTSEQLNKKRTRSRPNNGVVVRGSQKRYYEVHTGFGMET